MSDGTCLGVCFDTASAAELRQLRDRITQHLRVARQQEERAAEIAAAARARKRAALQTKWLDAIQVICTELVEQADAAETQQQMFRAERQLAFWEQMSRAIQGDRRGRRQYLRLDGCLHHAKPPYSSHGRDRIHAKYVAEREALRAAYEARRAGVRLSCSEGGRAAPLAVPEAERITE